jgi:DNA-directed RNA polymerase specialized sigma24 family protein
MSDITLADYETAVEKLPPLTRVVFLLHRVHNFSYVQIMRHLKTTDAAVQSCMCEALFMIDTSLRGEAPERWQDEPLLHAEAELRQRHRAYSERRLRFMGVGGLIAWDGEDDEAITRIIMEAMPPLLHETFTLRDTRQLAWANIANRTATPQWIVRWRMFVATGYVALKPKTFEKWLWSGTPSGRWII